MRIGVDVGGTNTDAVLMDGRNVVAFAKEPTTADVKSGVVAAIGRVMTDSRLASKNIVAVMIGTTQFANALVERAGLDEVGIIRLASPSGEALPPMTSWPEELAGCIGRNVYLLPGGYEVDGREIAGLDEHCIRDAVRSLHDRNIRSIAISSVFSPMNDSMEIHAAEIIADTWPEATISLSSKVGRLGLVERENSVILNAALTSLARRVADSFANAIRELQIEAPLYISQNDGTLITADTASRYPILTIGSGPTNSMRGAAFLTGIRDGIVMDVGGTTCDVGALTNGFPRESTVAVDIGGVRTNFRMPDILSIGLGGGTRIHLNPEALAGDPLDETGLQVGPDSVGYRICQESYLFGGNTLTTSDIAAATGRANFGNKSLLPPLAANTHDRIWRRIQAMLEDGLDRMKTSRDEATIIAVGGGNFLVSDALKGAAEVVRPPHASVANAVGAAIAQIGAQIEQIVDYDVSSRDEAIAGMRDEAILRVISSGGRPESVEIVDLEEVYLSYLPGRSAQVRIKAVGDLADFAQSSAGPGAETTAGLSHAN